MGDAPEDDPATLEAASGGVGGDAVGSKTEEAGSPKDGLVVAESGPLVTVGVGVTGCGGIAIGGGETMAALVGAGGGFATGAGGGDLVTAISLQAYNLISISKGTDTLS